VSTLDLAQRALLEGATFRGVGRARLLLPDRECEHATRCALEDALRTADFADAGRLIVMRALRLKGLPRGASGPQIARALEAAWQSMAPSAVAFDAPGADAAIAVWFRSVHAARLGWVRRFALQAAPGEWFWPRALPELVRHAAPQALTAMIVALHREAPAALAAEIESWPAFARIRLLLALPAARVDALLPAATDTRPPRASREWQDSSPARRHDAMPRASHDSAPVFAADDPGAVAPASTLPPEAAHVVALGPIVAALGSADWRVRWIAALMSRTVTAAAIDFARIDALVQAAQAGITHEPVNRASTQRSRPARAQAAQADAPLSEPVHVQQRDGATPRAKRPRDRLPAPVYPWLHDNAFSAFGGFLMIVNALEALGFSAWLDKQPPAVAAHFGRALLARLAARLRMPADDPHAPLLHLDDEAQLALAAARCDDGLTVAEAAWQWRCILARALRQHARLGIARLVLRPAGLSITPTHVDIVMPLAEADLAVRRVGLDRDPGWVAWLGWIVAFHYVEGARDVAG
jgi:hypothetical protein